MITMTKIRSCRLGLLAQQAQALCHIRLGQKAQPTRASFNGNVLSCFLLTTLLSACAPPKPSQEITMPAPLKVSELSSWELSGAIAAKNNQKGWSASLNWLQQKQDHYQIRLFGPLGGGGVMIENNGGTISYVDGKTKLSSHNPDGLLEEQTGVRLPVNNLYYWVRGIPSPNSPSSTQYDASGHLNVLTQAGYTIHYERYTRIHDLDLPMKIQLQSNEINIKVIIKQWMV
jgi:outer membrane lipoprotein LolB